MKQSIYILFLCLLLPAGLSGALLPGDFAVVRVAKDEVTLLALRTIPANEEIKVSDHFFVHGKFDGSGSESTIAISRKLYAGQQYGVDLSAHGISFDWGETLHFYQENASAYGPKLRHLFMVEANKSGLRWFKTPVGLEPDLTHIVIRELEGFENEIDHIYNGGLLDLNLTPYQWLRALGSFRSWVHIDQFIDIPLLDLLGLKFLVLPSPGIIEFTADAYHLNEISGTISVPVRRLYGNSGTATVYIDRTNLVEPLYEWDNESVDEYYADLTSIAYSPLLDYAVAVSPDSGTLLIGKPGNWQSVDTNADPHTNLGLSSITHDGTDFWACSKSGRIYKSSNGTNWTLDYAPTSGAPSLYRIVFLQQAQAQGKPALIALGSEGQILYEDPSDGWQTSASGSTDTKLFSVAFDGLNFVAVGEGGTLLSTQNLAQKWQSRTSPTERDLYDVFHYSGNTGGGLYAVGEFGIMLHAADLSDGFDQVESGTAETLFSINSATLEVDPNTGETASYLVASGAGGTVTAAKDGGNFTLRRSIHRASALYSILPIVSTSSGLAQSLIAIGEYGAIVSMKTVGHSLSGNPDNIQLNSESTTSLTWPNLDNSEKYVEVTASSADVLRQRTDLVLQKPLLGGSYRLGRHRTQVNLMDAINSKVHLAPNFGPLLYLAGTGVEINSLDQWELKFKIGNTSNRASGRLFLRFDGTNLPDWEIPTSQLPGSGAGIAAQTVSADIIKVLSQPVETVSLYEEFRPGETVLKYEKIINSMWAAPEWSPNDIFPRSLGIYLLDNGSLLDPGIPGISDILGLIDLPDIPILPWLLDEPELLEAPVALDAPLQQAAASESIVETVPEILTAPIQEVSADQVSTEATYTQPTDFPSWRTFGRRDSRFNAARNLSGGIVNTFWTALGWSPQPSAPRSFGFLDLLGLRTAKSEATPVTEPVAAEPVAPEYFTRAALSYSSSGSGGSTFSDGVPTPPPNSPGDPELILTDTRTQGPIGVEIRTTSTFFLEGDFYNTGTGVNEVYTINTVDWSVVEGSAPAASLEIESDGTLEVQPNPSLSYPRYVSTESVTTEGAPLDENDEPMEFTDSQPVWVARPASDLSYTDWMSSKSSLSGDDAHSLADPDGDNQVNLLEFAFDLDPENSDSRNLLGLSYDAKTSSSTFVVTIPKDRDGLVYIVETTNDLSATPVEWTPQSVTLVEDLGSAETWEATITHDGDQMFGRIRVEEDAR